MGYIAQLQKSLIIIGLVYIFLLEKKLFGDIPRVVYTYMRGSVNFATVIILESTRICCKRGLLKWFLLQNYLKRKVQVTFTGGQFSVQRTSFDDVLDGTLDAKKGAVSLPQSLPFNKEHATIPCDLILLPSFDSKEQY